MTLWPKYQHHFLWVDPPLRPLVDLNNHKINTPSERPFKELLNEHSCFKKFGSRYQAEVIGSQS